MSFLLSKISLQARLLLTTTFALIALLVAIISVYRTAQTSNYYAERQASASVGAVLRELENGTDTFDRKRRVPPHVREAFEKYGEEKTRAVAIAIGAEREISAGFCNTQGEPENSLYNQNFSADETPYVQNICRTVNESEAHRYEFVNSTLFAETAVFTEASGGTRRVFALRSIGKSGIFADRFNFLTQGFLLSSVIGLLIFSFLTLRDWRRGMLRIEGGLQKIPYDLSERIAPPKIAELARISGEINRLTENLEKNLVKQRELEKNLAINEKLAALGRVASGVAHEIRNPLAAMKLKIQMAERSDFDKSKLKKTFAVLNEEIARLDNLISKMLDSGKQEKLNLEVVAPTEILRKRLEFIREKAEENNVKFEIQFPEDDESVKADREKLTQVFDNILLNALEAMPGGGVVSINFYTENDKVIYEITDSGAGISPAEKEKIFEPFFTTKDGGTGLGLAVSREIVKAHGGRLVLMESAKGTKFRLELPTLKL